MKNGHMKSQPFMRFTLRDILLGADWYFLGMIAIYTIILIIFHKQIPNVGMFFMQNVFLTLTIISIATLGKYRSGNLFINIHRYYHLPIIYVIFMQVFVYISVLNPHDYDQILAGWDRALFGMNPTEYIQQFTFPALTEFLQIAYVLFYFHAFAQSIELNLRGLYEEAESVTRTIVFGFLLSYVMYVFMPAIGPRFSVHDYASISTDLPGLWLTDALRTIIDTGDGFRDKTLDPSLQMHRNCMPSGHTMMTLMNMILSFRYRSKLRWVFLIMGISLIIATVYLRYHYVVDVLAGIILVFAALGLESWIYSFLQSRNLIKKVSMD
ncbi:MAG: phosphatase PAP2 family protein [Ignavibacteria bacterium]|nr:phosphatase PAP2 family protein [Ignavibacteria bacterium]